MSITRLRSHASGRAAIALAAALLLGACSRPANEGPLRSESRSVGDFHSVNVRGAANASIQVGPAASLTISAGENTLQNLTTTVREGMLIVEQKKGWWLSHGNVELQITLPVLQEVVISGAGNADITDARGESLELSLQGAGNLVAKGEIGTLAVNINGAGNANLGGLRARAAKVVVNGTGNVSVHATEELDAVVNGVGSVRYIGTPPKLDTKVNGVGSIVQAPAGP